jgi:hypothetical protein
MREYRVVIKYPRGVFRVEPDVQSARADVEYLYNLGIKSDIESREISKWVPEIPEDNQ